MTGADVASLLGTDDAPLVLDVRSAFEFRRGHVPGALHVAFWTLPLSILRVRTACRSSAREQHIVVYCGHGPRAWYAGAWLRRAGYSHVEYLEGHMVRWRRERRPLERDG